MEDLIFKAEQGDAEAQFALGKRYFYGNRDVSQDDEQAFYWYRKAAEQGHASAQTSLGLYYRYQANFEDQDYEEAVHWYRRAAEQGDAEAQFELGSCYTDGDGVPRDAEQANYWYLKAAEQGYDDAQVALEKTIIGDMVFPKISYKQPIGIAKQQNKTMIMLSII